MATLWRDDGQHGMDDGQMGLPRWRTTETQEDAWLDRGRLVTPVLACYCDVRTGH